MRHDAKPRRCFEAFGCGQHGGASYGRPGGPTGGAARAAGQREDRRCGP